MVFKKATRLQQQANKNFMLVFVVQLSLHGLCGVKACTSQVLLHWIVEVAALIERTGLWRVR